jgi:hypothetical protein
VKRVLLAGAIVIVFVVGIAVGEAAHDNPKPGGRKRLFAPCGLCHSRLRHSKP